MKKIFLVILLITSTAMLSNADDAIIIDPEEYPLSVLHAGETTSKNFTITFPDGTPTNVEISIQAIPDKDGLNITYNYIFPSHLEIIIKPEMNIMPGNYTIIPGVRAEYTTIDQDGEKHTEYVTSGGWWDPPPLDMPHIIPPEVPDDTDLKVPGNVRYHNPPEENNLLLSICILGGIIGFIFLCFLISVLIELYKYKKKEKRQKNEQQNSK